MAVRAIDASRFGEILEQWKKDCLEDNDTQGADIISDVILQLDDMPTLTPPNEWVSVEDELPKLPDRDWCAVKVNTAQKGNPKSRPMIYERAIVRGKRVERWKYCWDRIADELPDYWMPLPTPPDRRPTEEKEDAQ